MKKYILEAHRGVGTEYPEETMAAFQAAAEQGYGMIELDTKFTKDNCCVLLHDRTVNRTGRKADGTAFAENKKISDMTLAEVMELDFGSWKAPAFAGEKIPLLEQVLSMAMEAKIPLKFDNVLWSHTPEQQKIFLDTIRNMGAQYITEITCAEMDTIRIVRTQLPEVRIHYDGPVSEENLEQVAALVPKELLTTWIRFDNAITAWCKNPSVNKENAALAKKYGRLGVWLLTEPMELKTAVHQFGADVIETDGTLKP